MFIGQRKFQEGLRGIVGFKINLRGEGSKVPSHLGVQCRKTKDAPDEFLKLNNLRGVWD